MDRTKLEAIANEAVREVGFSFKLTSVVMDSGTWEIWFSGMSPAFSVKIQDKDLSHEGLVRSLIKLELLKHAVAGQHTTTLFARRDSGEGKLR